MKKEESSVLKENVPDFVFLFLILTDHHLQFSYDSEIPSYFLYIFKNNVVQKAPY